MYRKTVLLHNCRDADRNKKKKCADLDDMTKSSILKFKILAKMLHFALSAFNCLNKMTCHLKSSTL